MLDMVSLLFIRFLYLPPAWNCFEARKVFHNMLFAWCCFLFPSLSKSMECPGEFCWRSFDDLRDTYERSSTTLLPPKSSTSHSRWLATLLEATETSKVFPGSMRDEGQATVIDMASELLRLLVPPVPSMLQQANTCMFLSLL